MKRSIHLIRTGKYVGLNALNELNHIVLHKIIIIINVNVILFYSDETDSIHMSQRAYLWVDQEEMQKGRDIQILLGKC